MTLPALLFPRAMSDRDETQSQEDRELFRSQPMVRAIIDGVVERLGRPSAATGISASGSGEPAAGSLSEAGGKSGASPWVVVFRAPPPPARV